jgi:hypothetical protein
MLAAAKKADFAALSAFLEGFSRTAFVCAYAATAF